ncbi:hypothetical protein FGG08_001478 [Glutinoglossum americanum]|uniref:Uncharacterized protein n=1 Tax=Glutinoglossum americanum TaxID=1670608 RepID=A0A9P8I845_9PEZI|nr:hypothetical protein FGG08_001478 [Glutinoglossum americanum]
MGPAITATVLSQKTCPAATTGNKGLPEKSVAGIAVGVAIAVSIFWSILLWYCVHRASKQVQKQNREQVQEQAQMPSIVGKSELPPSNDPFRHELGTRRPLHELPL